MEEKKKQVNKQSEHTTSPSSPLHHPSRNLLFSFSFHYFILFFFYLYILLEIQLIMYF